mmetsp:Transcript_31707/g.101238  ORF Transcript_31707/g.101238 Transcript_31707/m.101238 type:complete len:287 (+) Transcript_31707:413-1273(+)
MDVPSAMRETTEAILVCALHGLVIIVFFGGCLSNELLHRLLGIVKPRSGSTTRASCNEFLAIHLLLDALCLGQALLGLSELGFKFLYPFSLLQLLAKEMYTRSGTSNRVVQRLPLLHRLLVQLSMQASDPVTAMLLVDLNCSIALGPEVAPPHKPLERCGTLDHVLVHVLRTKRDDALSKGFLRGDVSHGLGLMQEHLVLVSWAHGGSKAAEDVGFALFQPAEQTSAVSLRIHLSEYTLDDGILRLGRLHFEHVELLLKSLFLSPQGVNPWLLLHLYSSGSDDLLA